MCRPHVLSSSEVLMRRLLIVALPLALAHRAGAQRTYTAADSALVGRILVAEDRRDATNQALADGLASQDWRVHMLAGRALARNRDPKFAARDSFPSPVAPPEYNEPAWRLRYRALADAKGNCAALGEALGDSAWSVRLRAIDLVGRECAIEAGVMSKLQRWAGSPPTNTIRAKNGVSWQPAAHSLVALSRIAPAEAKRLLPRFAESAVPWLRTYAARAAATVQDTSTLRRLAADANGNVQEAAIDGLSRVAGHDGDPEYVAALASSGYQAVRSAARALKGSPRGPELVGQFIATERRLRRDSSETSRDARLAVMERIAEFARRSHLTEVVALGDDFDCAVSSAASSIATRLTGGIKLQSVCARPRIALPRDAVALALGKSVMLRVTLADSSGGGWFTVRLRGDVAPVTAARILDLARSGYYNGLIWHRVEPDFVIQGGGLDANEYVGNPRFFRDELGTVPHVRGTVGMSTRGHDTGDGQWFINLRDNLRLNADYTVFGEVVDGIDVVDGVLEGDVIARIEPVP
jgi:cyclophilin family peptidyl-prolyl cis-trans isomerase